jgi:hypothetical protein
MLLTEGDADNRNKKYDAPKQMGEHKNKSPADNPYHIQYEPTNPTAVVNLLAKGPQSQPSQFKGLQTNRYADYRYAAYQTCD